MKWRAGRYATCIGVDFDGRFMHAAQVVRSGNGHRLEAAARIPRVAPEENLGDPDVAQLRGTLTRLGFTGRRLVLGVPEDKLAVDILEMPPRNSGAPVDQIARGELARTHGFEAGSAEMFSWDLPPSSRAKDMTQMMVVAFPHADADPILDLFDRAGLRVDVLEAPMCAVVRACRPVLPRDGLAAILHLGWDWALLLLLHHGAVVYRRLMPENSLKLCADAITRKLDLPAESVDCLLEEIGLTGRPEHPNEPGVPLDSVRTLIRKPLDGAAEALTAAFSYARQMYGRSNVQTILITGQGAAVPGADAHLGSRLGQEVRIVTPRDTVRALAPGAEAEAGPSLTPAVGLALYQEGHDHAERKPHSVAQA